MASFYHTFTTTRQTEPDVPSLLAQLRTSDATAGIQHSPGGPYKIKKDGGDWTPAQIAAVQTMIDTAPEPSALLRYTRTSRDKDVLATLAMIVRARNITAWNALTTQQKVTAALAEADVWITIRDFLETTS